MITKRVNVNLSGDAESRPVAVLVQIASKFDSKIYFLCKDKRVNAKSIMGMMSLGFAKGDSLEIEADGLDESTAIEELANYIQSNE